MTQYLLVGDIGGTKTNLALYSASNFVLTIERNYQNKAFTSAEQLVRQFHQDVGFVASAACFGVAGAVHSGRCNMPNLGWTIDSEALSQTFTFDRTILLNDLEATAYGIASLKPNQMLTINEGVAQADGNIALIAAGTGLGEAMLFHTSNGYQVVATEGGHADFAPRSELEIALLHHLRNEYIHVSWERVVSGPGLKNIYDFLKNSGIEIEPEWLAGRFAQGQDASAIIASCALQNEAEICTRALNLFMASYGAEAGNLALKALATGGLYIGGGIAPKIIAKFHEDAFLSSFVNKGRFSTLLANIPVKIILEPKTALVGALAYLKNKL